MAREYPTRPIVGVGILVRNEEKILLVRRENEPGKGRWSIPGGLLELGEKIQDGAKREIREETGLEVEIYRLIDVGENITYDRDCRIRFHYVLIDFLGHSVEGNLKADTDVKEAQYVNLKEVGGLPITNTLKRLLAKAALHEA